MKERKELIRKKERFESERKSESSLGAFRASKSHGHYCSFLEKPHIMPWNLYPVPRLIIRKLTIIFWNIAGVGAIKVFNGMKPSQGERAIHAVTESKLKEYCTHKET